MSSRRRRLGRSVTAVIGVLLIGTLVWLVGFSSVLDVRTVEVSGQRTLKPAQLEQVAAVPRGEPLSRLDTTAIEARVQRVPRVREVEVSRSWPHTVSIEVVERTAIVWARENGEIRGIDRDGVDFRSYEKPPDDLIEAKVAVTDPEAQLQTVRAVASVADELRRRDPRLKAAVQAISAETRDSIVLDLTKGRTVTWGSADQGERKLEVLDTLLRIDASGYDVSAPDQPTTSD